jgi:uncharacterized delta-60 repeat protein
LERLEDRTLLTGGVLDPTFGNGGLVQTNLTLSSVNSTALEPDGSVVVAGLSNGATTGFAVARFTPQGNPDTTFNGTGFQVTQFPGSASDQATAVAIDSQGRIVVAGTTMADGGPNFGVVRYNSDGSLDTTFGKSGFVIVNFNSTAGTFHTSATSVAIRSDGRIVVAGNQPGVLSGGKTYTQWAVARLNADGSTDSDFHSNGEDLVNFGATLSPASTVISTDILTSVGIQSNGQIVAVGYTNLQNNFSQLDQANNFAVARFNDDGTLDKNFGGGLLVTDFFLSPFGKSGPSPFNDQANQVTFQPDGKILVSGVSQTEVNGNGGSVLENNFAVARYTTGGALDNTFASDGIVVTDLSTDFTFGSIDQANSLVVQQDGRIVLAGETNTKPDGTRGPNANFGLIRYNTDGTLDQTFGVHGKTVTDISAGDDVATSLDLLANGQLLVGGTYTNGASPNFVLARYSGVQAGSLQFSAPTFNAAENGGTATVTVTRLNGNDGTVMVNYATSDGTAVAGTDYTATSGTLTFSPTDTSQTITIPVKDDNLFTAGNKTINLTLSNPTGTATLGTQSTAVLNLIETDAQLQFHLANFNVNENDGTATVTVDRGGASGGGTVTVNYATSDGTAKGVINYGPTSGTLTIGPTDTSKTFTVSLRDDGVFGPPTTFFNVTLSSPQGGASLGSTSTATVTVAESDKPGTFQFSAPTYSFLENVFLVNIPITRTGGSDGLVTVDVGTTPGTPNSGPEFGSINTSTLFFAAGETTKNFSFTLRDDNFFQSPNEVVQLSLSNPTSGATIGAQSTAAVTIVETDQLGIFQFSQANYSALENSGSAKITVTRTNGTQQPVTVDVSAAPTTPSSGPEFSFSPMTLQFAAGETSKTLSVPLTDDGVYNSPDEILLLALSNPENGATLNALAPTLASLDIVETDQVGTLQFAAPTYSASEKDGSVNITVTRTGGSNGYVTANYSASPASGSEFNVAAGSVTFGPGVTSQVISIPLTDDIVVTPDQTTTLTLTSTGGGAALGTQTSTVLTVHEADNPPTIQFAAANYSALENSGLATLTLTRTGNTKGLVSVIVDATPATPNSGPEFIVHQTLVDFADGETTKTVTVALKDDQFFQSPNEMVSLSLSSPTGGAVIGAQGSTTLTIIETDQLGVFQFSQANYTALENSVGAVITVTRTGGSQQPVTVDVAAAPATPSTGPEFNFKPTTLSFAAGQTTQTFTVYLTDDGVFTSPNEVLLMMLSNPQNGATLGAVTEASLTIIETDQVGVLQFAAPAFSASENDGTASLVVTRTGGTNGSITANYSASPGSNTEYTLPDGSITFGPGESSKTISVPLTNDGVYTPDQTVTVTLSSPAGGAFLGTQTQTVLTIHEGNQPGVVQFGAATYTAKENSGVATVTVIRSSGTDGPVSVVVDATTGTPNIGPEFLVNRTVLNFAAGQNAQTVSIPLKDDGGFQTPDETVSLSLSGISGGATIGAQGTTVVTILETNGGSSNLFVAQVYRDLLGREVDPAGLASWTAFLDAGGSRQLVALAITQSQEYRTDVIQSLYQHYLHRAADPTGLNTFTGMLAAGGTDEQVAEALVASPEYFQNRGHGSNDGFLDALYSDVLNRAVDPTGRAGFDRALSTGTSRGQVATIIFGSTEYRQDLVQSFYQRFLGRAADAGGLNTFVSLLQSHPSTQLSIVTGDPLVPVPSLRDEDIMALIIGSQEYLSRLS